MMDTNKIYRIKLSKKTGKPVAYTSEGKVILIENSDDVHIGFAHLLEQPIDKKTCFVAKMENIVYDYYTGISYEEFEKVLANFGFELEYEEFINKKDGTKYKIWAKLDTGEIITTEEICVYGRYTYNTIKFFILTERHLIGRVFDKIGLGTSSYSNAYFDVVHSATAYPIRSIYGFSTHSRDWRGDHPYIWHYDAKDNGDNTADSLIKLVKCKHPIVDLFNMDLCTPLTNLASKNILPKDADLKYGPDGTVIGYSLR